MIGKYLALNISSDMTKCYGEELRIEYQGNSIVYVNGIDCDNELYYIEDLISKLSRYKDKLDEYYKLKRNKKVSDTVSLKLSYIYLMYNESDGFYKIGRSLNPQFRERTLQAQAPKVNTIFLSPLTYQGNEKKLHNHFKEKRIRGEWFLLDKCDIEFIKSFNYSTNG